MNIESESEILIFDSVAALPERFRTFLRENSCDDLFLSDTWFELLSQHGLPHSHTVRIYAVADTGAVHSLLFTAVEHRSAWHAPLRLLSLTNFYTMTYAPVLARNLVDPGPVIAALARAIAQERPRWDVINLRSLVSESPVTECLVNGFRAAGMLVDTYFQFENWYHPTAGVSAEAYFKSRPSKLRNTVLRKTKKADKEHKLEFRLYQTAAEVARGIPDFEHVYARSWKDPEQFPGFIPNLLLTYAEAGVLRLGLLYVDGSPAAAQIWLVTAIRAIIYKLAYDEQFASMSPGSILTKRMFDHVLDVDKVPEVDYGIGSEPYKLDWMSAKRNIVGLIAFNSRSARGLWAGGVHFGRGLLRRLQNRLHTK